MRHGRAAGLVDVVDLMDERLCGTFARPGEPAVHAVHCVHLRLRGGRGRGSPVGIVSQTGSSEQVWTGMARIADSRHPDF